MNTCPNGKNLKKLNFLQKKHSIVNLILEGVSEEDYEHARSGGREFGIKNLGENHHLYLQTDVILLANVFEAFSVDYLKNYDLDLAHFYTAPVLAWKACLKKTRIRLSLINNLYGWAMSQPLPTGKFKWVEVKPNEIRKLVKCKDKGYLLEVDVKYPKELHDSHNDFPFKE